MNFIGWMNLCRSALTHSLFGLALVQQDITVSKNPNGNCSITALIKCCPAVSRLFTRVGETAVASDASYCYARWLLFFITFPSRLISLLALWSLGPQTDHLSVLQPVMEGAGCIYEASSFTALHGQMNHAGSDWARWGLNYSKMSS